MGDLTPEGTWRWEVVLLEASLGSGAPSLVGGWGLGVRDCYGVRVPSAVVIASARSCHYRSSRAQEEEEEGAGGGVRSRRSGSSRGSGSCRCARAETADGLIQRQ